MPQDTSNEAQQSELSPITTTTTPTPTRTRTIRNISRVPPEHPIQYWEERLLGKKAIAEDAHGDETVSPTFSSFPSELNIHPLATDLTHACAQTFKQSDLPKLHAFRPGAHNCLRVANR